MYRRKRISWIEIFLDFSLILVIFSSGWVAYYFYSKNNIETHLKKEENKLLNDYQKKEQEIIEQFTAHEEEYLSFLNSLKNGKNKDIVNKYFDDFKAKSVFVKKIGGDVIFSKNSSEILPIASITKIITAITAIETNRGDVLISRSALKTEGRYNLSSYEKFSLKDAISFMLIRSVNDIASAIALGNHPSTNNKNQFIKKMNNLIHSLGIKTTLLFSETGLDRDRVVLGSYSTAEDIAKIVEYFYTRYPDYAKETAKNNVKICSNKKCHIARNTNKLVQKYPEIKFTKTGYTRKSGGSVTVVVEFQGRQYIIVVLGSTIKERLKDLEKAIIGLKFFVENNENLN